MASAFIPSHRGGSGAPMVCLHGFTDTWRTWELVLPALEQRHEVFAPTLPGHAGGPPVDGETDESALIDSLEAMLDEAGIETAHLVGNSLGGYVALRLAARGRARSVVALAPAGGWPAGDPAFAEARDYFVRTQELARAAAPHADQLVSSDDGRRRATAFITVNYEHIPPDLIAHLIRGAAECPVADAFIEQAVEHGWDLDAERIDCPVRVVWGTEDRILHWPHAATRFREEWLPHADWVELEGVGHCPQLDVPAETADLILGFAD